MTELENNIFIEKWRPQNIDDVILDGKDNIKKFMNSTNLPSFIFHSRSAGTGKTTTARLLMKDLDVLELNASKDRGIDIIRDRVNLFVQCSSSNGKQRCVFMDEADGLTPQAQDALKSPMETYSKNSFFIFTCNDISKIIDPIKSRCIALNFERPHKGEIKERLEKICEAEQISYDDKDIIKLIELYYPDIRAMIMSLQRSKVGDESLLVEQEDFFKLYQAIMKGDIKHIYDKVYSTESFNIMAFNKWLFKLFYDNHQKFSPEQLSKVSLLLADTEKSYNLGISLPIVFIANITEVSRLLKR